MKKQGLAIRLLNCSCGLLLLLSLVVGSASYASQQSRGQSVRIKVGGQELDLYAESYALVIGVSEYGNGWKKLPGTKRDVTEVSAVLRKQGFVVETMLDPTRSQLDERLRAFISENGLAERNRLLVYFAGHGYTERVTDGREMGYIVAVDAPLPERNPRQFSARAISMNEMETYALLIKSKHAMFVFDSCFSGTIFETRRGNRTVPPAIESKTAAPVRFFITAGTKGQEVPDDSIFRAYFVRALDGEGDLNNDSFVTGEELGVYLSGRVARESRETQTPRYGKIRDARLNIGDFVFALPKREMEKPPLISTPPLAQSQEIAVKKQEQPETNNSNVPPKQGLIDAVNEGNIGVVQDLLNRGVDVNAIDSRGSTPLIAAVNKCSFGIAKALLDKGANIEAINSTGVTALMTILSKSSGCANVDRIAQLLLEAGANVNAKDIYGNTAFIQAITGGCDDKIIDDLLAKGANVNAKNNEGKTALMLCMGTYRSGAVVKALIARGTDIEAKDDKGQTALMAAAINRKSEMASILLNAGAKVDVMDSENRTLLIIAIQSGIGFDTVKSLLNRELNVGTKDKQGRTALMWAANYQWIFDPMIVRALLENGADAQARDNEGKTALLIAATRNQEIVRILLEYRSDINARDNEGKTALMLAATTSAEIVQMLLEKMADVTVKDNKGWTALTLAEEKPNNEKIIEMLKRAWAK